MYLAVSLRGQTQLVLGDLAGGVPKKLITERSLSKKLIKELITILNERFSPPNQSTAER